MQRRVVLYSALHGVVLAILVLFWQRYGPRVLDGELTLLRWNAIIKQTVLKTQTAPPTDSILFVDVGWSKALIDKLDANGFPIGNQAITDRGQLASFLSRLNNQQHPHRYLVLDVIFPEASPQDSALGAELARLQNYVASAHLTDSGRVETSVFPLRIGISDYRQVEDGFVRFRTHHIGGHPSLPAIMARDLNGDSLQPWGPFALANGQLAFNVFVPDLRIRQYQFADYPKVYLAELAAIDDSLFQELTRDRLIVVGDFENLDLHPTLFGLLPGPLLLLNVYLALANHDNLLDPALLLLLWLVGTLISIKAFSTNDYWDQAVRNRFGRTAIGRLAVNLLSYVVFFWLLTILAYFIFGIHLFLLAFVLYMQGLENLVHWWQNRQKKQRESRLLALANTKPGFEADSEDPAATNAQNVALGPETQRR